MAWLPEIDISASGIYAQRAVLNTIANNIANIKTTKTITGEPYRRKEVILREKPEFREYLELPQLKTQLYITHKNHIDDHIKMRKELLMGGGVEIKKIAEDKSTPFVKIYNPSHPDADSNGYVILPNIDITQELIDMMVARRAFEANVSVITTSRQMIFKSLEIGR